MSKENGNIMTKNIKTDNGVMEKKHIRFCSPDNNGNTKTTINNESRIEDLNIDGQSIHSKKLNNNKKKSNYILFYIRKKDRFKQIIN